ncbi:MAG: RNA 2',3'-cyclic phosphodiesterase [Deferribacterota bacterium]|nr:RNA 2',3'-cyclic phosphodiesterase [Deferribacterota bacterium]
MRAFLGIEPPICGPDLFYSLATSFKEYCKASFVKKENYHITLFFFGEITNKTKDNIIEVLEQLDFEKIDISLHGVGCFYKNNTPRVCFVEGRSEKLSILHNIIRKRFKINKIHFDDKSLKIHLTLFRVKKVYSLEGFNNNINFINKNFKPLNFLIEHIILYNSLLSSMGPTYKKIYQKRLT